MEDFPKLSVRSNEVREPAVPREQYYLLTAFAFCFAAHGFARDFFRDFVLAAAFGFCSFGGCVTVYEFPQGGGQFNVAERLLQQCLNFLPERGLCAVHCRALQGFDHHAAGDSDVAEAIDHDKRASGAVS
jgi:hypothetical protein